MARPKILAATTLSSLAWTRFFVNFPVGSLLLQCRTSVNVMIALSADPGEAYWTIKAGASLEMDVSGWRPKGFLYAKAASGTPQLEIITLV